MSCNPHRENTHLWYAFEAGRAAILDLEVIRLKAELAILRAASFTTAVPSEEYEKLSEENLDLKYEAAKWKRAHDAVESKLMEVCEENARLKAEVERFKFTLEEERQITRQDWAGLRCEHDRVKRALEQAEAEVDRLTDALNKLVKTPPEATGGVRVKVDFWTQYGSRLPSSYETFWENAAKEGKQS